MRFMKSLYVYYSLKKSGLRRKLFLIVCQKALKLMEAGLPIRFQANVLLHKTRSRDARDFNNFNIRTIPFKFGTHIMWTYHVSCSHHLRKLVMAVITHRASLRGGYGPRRRLGTRRRNIRYPFLSDIVILHFL